MGCGRFPPRPRNPARSNGRHGGATSASRFLAAERKPPPTLAGVSRSPHFPAVPRAPHGGALVIVGLCAMQRSATSGNIGVSRCAPRWRAGSRGDDLHDRRRLCCRRIRQQAAIGSQNPNGRARPFRTRKHADSWQPPRLSRRFNHGDHRRGSRPRSRPSRPRGQRRRPALLDVVRRDRARREGVDGGGGLRGREVRINPNFPGLRLRRGVGHRPRARGGNHVHHARGSNRLHSTGG